MLNRDRQEDYLQDIYDDGDVWEMRRQRHLEDQERLSRAGRPLSAEQDQMESDTFHNRVMQHLSGLRDTASEATSPTQSDDKGDS